MDSYGFIITRHVNSAKTNKYWNQCVKCIRTLYPLKKIVIIDDNSNKNFIKMDFPYTNVIILESQHKGRGEFLPYYYFLKNKFFENAVIIHDSVFIHKRIQFESLIGTKVMPLWYFNPDKENLTNTLRICDALRDRESWGIRQKLTLENAILGMQHTKWYGCFGVQSFINHDFLVYIEDKYKISNMISKVLCRADRCCLERIMGCIFFSENNPILNKKSLFGNIMKYYTYGYSYDEYERDFARGRLPKAVVKVWTGR